MFVFSPYWDIITFWACVLKLSPLVVLNKYHALFRFEIAPVCVSFYWNITIFLTFVFETVLAL